MPRRRSSGASRGGRRGGVSWAAVIAALIVVAVAVLVAGLAAFVTVPAAIVLISLVVFRPQGAGLRVRGWRLWRRVRGLEPTRGRATFAAVLTLYGVLIPGACLAILVAVVRSSGTTPNGQAQLAPTASDTPAASAPEDTGFPSADESPAASPSQATLPPAAPQTQPPPVLADACHQHGVTYCVLNPTVTQATIARTICVSGWTATVRPPESYTESLKEQQIAAEGLPGGLSSYEEDHRMPLELGGAPRDPMNLSPESPAGPNAKDSDETALKDEVCSGQLTLAQAQTQMVATWLAAYPGYRS
jgi:hypothetical protein